ncbi:hypothetical protein U1Q18_042987 [Sarracenia purpurea var. burkii]
MFLLDWCGALDAMGCSLRVVDMVAMSFGLGRTYHLLLLLVWSCCHMNRFVWFVAFVGHGLAVQFAAVNSYVYAGGLGFLALLSSLASLVNA